MGLKVTNNAYGTLNAGITSSSTTIVLNAGEGARFPTLSAGDYFYATLIDTTNNLEIVKVTARSTDTMTVVRAQDNTTARAFSTNDRFELRPTAILFNEIIAEADAALPLAGGTMTGPLTLGGKLDRQLAGDATAIEVRGSFTGNPKIFEVAQTSSDGILYVRDGAGNASQIHSWSGGTSIIRGRVQHPQQPHFEAYRVNSQGLTASTWNTLIADATNRNQGSHYSTSTGIFTAPVAGIYQFNFLTLFYPVSEGVLVDLRVLINGSTVTGQTAFQCSAPAGNHFGRSASFVTYLAANDTWRLQANPSASSVTFYGGQAHLSGCLLG